MTPTLLVGSALLLTAVSVPVFLAIAIWAANRLSPEARAWLAVTWTGWKTGLLTLATFGL